MLIHMDLLTVGEFKSKFSEVITKILHGESIGITYGKNKKKVAALVPYKRYAQSNKIKLGIIKQATYKIHEDFKMTALEYLQS